MDLLKPVALLKANDLQDVLSCKAKHRLQMLKMRVIFFAVTQLGIVSTPGKHRHLHDMFGR